MMAASQHKFLPSWFAARETGVLDQPWPFRVELEFEILNNDGLPNGKWSLATYTDVKKHKPLVESKLGYGKSWYICRLQDGKVSGPGYNHELEKSEDTVINNVPNITDLGHQLVYSVVAIHKPKPPELKASQDAGGSDCESLVDDIDDLDLGLDRESDEYST